MRILLIAYEFSPSRSPRALRWGYLARELALLGHQVQVLAPRMGHAPPCVPVGPGKVGVHRTFAGPVMGLLGAMARRHRGAPGVGPATADGVHDTTPQLNRNGRLAERFKRFVGHFLYPDIRREWNPWARRALGRLLHRFDPHVVVTSHEPASTLLLGLRVQRKGFRWVADLGDPVCTTYTPPRWRARALALEREVCRRADRLIVTNVGACRLLAERHGLAPARCSVLPQGFDDRRMRSASMDGFFRPDRLEVLYTGRLYDFRRPDALLAALGRVEGVRVTFILADPTSVALCLDTDGDARLRILGPMPHERILDLQGQADVLLSLGNRGMPAQVPGKLYEYLGADRPILHLRAGADDAAAGILVSLGGMRICADSEDDVVSALDALRRDKAAGQLRAGPDRLDLTRYAMSSLGKELATILASAAADAVQPGRVNEHPEDATE